MKRVMVRAARAMGMATKRAMARARAMVMASKRALTTAARAMAMAMKRARAKMMGMEMAQRTWPLVLQLEWGGWWWWWARVCVCLFVCVERPRKIRLNLKNINASWSIDRARLAILKLADNMAQSISDICWCAQICIWGAGYPKTPDHGDYPPPVLPSALSPLSPSTNTKINDWWNCYLIFYPTTNPCTPPQNATHNSLWWAASTPHMPGTHCGTLRCDGGRPGRGSLSSSATH